MRSPCTFGEPVGANGLPIPQLLGGFISSSMSIGHLSLAATHRGEGGGDSLSFLGIHVNHNQNPGR